MHKPHAHPSRFAAMGVYATLLVLALLEQAGRVTSDTRISVIEAPLSALRSTFSLWNPQVSLGELQNQAYGYLFPMGPFFALGELAQVPGWVTERLWSVAILVVGCEGARLLARHLGLAAWPAWFAGMAYGLNARVMGQVATRSAEVLPGAVLPWLVIPVVLALSGRLRHRTAALLSVGAYLFMGAVNGTATIAPLPLVVIFLVWGVVAGRARWALLGWWSGLLVVASLWWAASLVQLSAYSPPFFDFVEDAKISTLTTGYFPSLRGADNWVSYLNVVDRPNWPAGHAFAYDGPLIALTTAVAALGLVGLVRMQGPWRQPLLLSAVLGLTCLTIGHVSSLQSPLAPLVQHLLDGPLALLRNVHKIDPVWRLPLAIGVGAAAAQWAQRTRDRQGLRRLGLVLVAALTLSTAQPAMAMNLRTPGWDEVPGYWKATADYLASRTGNNRAWVVPGVGFGVQNWGWTMDEPMSIVARSPWVTRSQVPLTPPETIRALSELEGLLDTGSGSPHLGEMLARMGLRYVVVRHDLELSLSEGTSSTLVALSLARSGGVTRVKALGRVGFGPAVEIYAVTRLVTPPVRADDLDRVVTVSSGPADVLEAVARGLLPAGRPAVVAGDDGWARPADVVGDGYRLRERNFGRVHDAVGPMRGPDDPREGGRVVPDYPGSNDAEPAYVRYFGIRDLSVSSTQASVEALGAVRPETGPFSAVDSDPATAWETAAFDVPDHEWLQVRLAEPVVLSRVTLDQPVGDLTVDRVETWRLDAGGRSVTAEADPLTGRATFWMGSVRASTIRVTAVRVEHPGARTSVGISQLDLGPEVHIGRTLVVPERDVAPAADYVFSAQPETSACVPTLLGPDCQASRQRVSEEAAGIDRTFTVPAAGRWELRGTVVARSGPATTSLLDPLGGRVRMRATSTFTGDPEVSVRMAYDGNPATSWIADPRDAVPVLTVDLDRPRTISKVSVSRPAAPAVAPSRLVIRSDTGGVRTVRLDGFGVLKPLRGRRFEILLRNPTRSGAPIGLGDLSLEPAGVTRRFRGAAETGAVCGFGPTVEAGGRRYRTRVAGLMGAVSSGGPLQLISCDGPIRLSAGEKRLVARSTNQFLPVEVTLVAPQRAPVRARSAGRSLVVASDGPDRQVYDLGPGKESLISTTRNFNPGWRATLDGEPLSVQRVDGWAQGWRVPAGNGGTLVLEYAPQRSYVVALVGGLILAGLILLAAAVSLVQVLRGRHLPSPARSSAVGWPRHAAEHVRRRRSRWRRFLRGETVLVLGWVVGGLPAAAGLILAWFGHRVRLPVVPVALMLIGGATVAAVLDNLSGPALATEPANIATGVAVVALLASSWPSPFAARPVPRRRTARRSGGSSSGQDGDR